MADLPDSDSQETQEWLDALDSVLEHESAERAHYLIGQLVRKAHLAGVALPISTITPYLNTIPLDKEQRSVGNYELEHRIRALTRWNAMAIVLNANRESSELGGHIATFASAATLYDVGFNHFFHGKTENHGGDLVYFQGHASPGMYARAFLEGRLSEEQLYNFRQEVNGGGLSSYPHPWLMPDFWQFPTVSMGLGPLMAIYQARFMRYLEYRGIVSTEGRKVWAFLGDGETDEPESLGAISMAAREKLDNLIFVINCNLQRLDGPVRGNGKIIQELEGVFRGAGWNVIKVVWGGKWDRLFAKDKTGLLLKRMEEVVDGEYQTYKSKNGAYVRQHFFGKYPELLELVADMSDEEIWHLDRGGHDPHKVFAAYAAAANHKGQPTVILAKTIKGYGMGEAGEAQNITHQQKKVGGEALRKFRDRFNIPVTDDQLSKLPFCRPPDDSLEMSYLRERSKALGTVPDRKIVAEPLQIPGLDAFEVLLKGTEDREISTTMAFVRMLGVLVKDKNIGKLVVPIVPDESRTFGMEGLFRQLSIFSQVGQLYTPQDADQLMFYKEDKAGQILQEGINEAGAMSSWIAASTAYANHGVAMVPFYIYYSMFGFQRVGDLMWAAGDQRARGFLLGGTAGRTTLNGEGLQHQDGHSHLMAATIPNCVSYDPTFAYELAVIIQDGMRRMYQEQEDVFYYLTVMNENYAHPAMPEGAETGIIRGMYLFNEGKAQSATAPTVQLLGSGTILREVIAAAELLVKDFGVASDIWSVTSFNELRRDGLDCERWNMLHPEAAPRVSYAEQCLGKRKGPVIAATDYIKSYADQIRAFLPGNYKVLGTDGFGRSDTRKKLRHFFEVDRYYIAVAALKALADEGTVAMSEVSKALKLYNINPDKPNPTTV
ncbi:MAG: pyruvate dehydrogenase (acetyl-transferring), homodimeric type [Candidatus Nitrotoga sp.]|nr:pyruvate dehydrogenase (acetyl-transferring), homodimeric type [Candidatus Nitrotoga sp.]RFC40582.1 MAG: pyruvate dehydrogenase E1 component [Candidatus Nitrotoga sp. CP45]MDO9447031.1 pyruvate dehydrogenase (acetyl-transferring), homodimeric type [Candidatus Nitrotoga sp.]MDP1639086.1 pyruvate dehydrogenase (acetyl-transferring), homodimeric type [Candidatus Nitrotoga sp.]MDP1855085.1 pyruvate dehydrogenase (acetyl-transferring), homodimeric type [Candidatus Nitrotoga sp.]